jgi:hypothetical protein
MELLADPLVKLAAYFLLPILVVNQYVFVWPRVAERRQLVAFSASMIGLVAAAVGLSWALEPLGHVALGQSRPGDRASEEFSQVLHMRVGIAVAFTALVAWLAAYAIGRASRTKELGR